MKAATSHHAFALIVAAAMFGAALATAAETDGPIIGQASVIDADTIEIHGTRIRLSGIDAPESDKVYVIRGSDEPCGRRAAFLLSDFIGRRTVYCSDGGRDCYGRTLAHCEVDGRDVGGTCSAGVGTRGCISYSGWPVMRGA